MNETTNSGINRLIPPDIKDDEFYRAIQTIALEEDIKTILEIGSSAGEGSTEAFVTGIRENLNQPTLFCLEVSQHRFWELQKRYAKDNFVKCYNFSSVSVNQFSTETEVIEFYRTTQTIPNGLSVYPLDTVLNWRKQNIEYIQDYGITENGISKIKKENNIDCFDVVLIDSSQFTGTAELDETYGAKYILLDDINTNKNYTNYHRLLVDPNYIVVDQNKLLRHGYAIFKKITVSFETEKAEQQLVKKLVRPNMTVFDIGANIGNYSMLFSEIVGKFGRVYSFEPTPSTFKTLQKRILQGEYKNVFAYNKAVFSENQLIEFNEFPEEYSVWNSLGIPQMLVPNSLNNEYVPVVRTELVEGIKIDTFCENHNIEKIDYLKLDVEGAESDALQGAANLIQKKAIRFLQFEISQKMLEGFNRRARDTFDFLIQNGYECHKIKGTGEIGEEVNNSESFYENYIAFPSLPVHIFTIVLNGEPFIRYHIEVFKQLPFKWHWHIIEGVADLKHDTAWVLRHGGHIVDEMHRNGRSNDGTTEYLDELAGQYPENVTVYRKPEGAFWDGKLEMVNAPLANINEECLLWQMDVDELWTAEQICKLRQLFISNPEKTAAFYWCWYFVGENLIISTRNCYAQNPHQEWLRTWRYKPGAIWASHSPPKLVEPLPNNQWRDVATVNPFFHEETEKEGLVFQHFAYVTPNQLQFKEQYYGYAEAVSKWKALQEQTKFPILLRQYFPWVKDTTHVDVADSLGIVPLARREKDGSSWQFVPLVELSNQKLKVPTKVSPRIIIDGVFFQLYKTGIARLWQSLLEEWVDNGFAKHIILLDRAGTAPEIPGIHYRAVPPYDYAETDADRKILQHICDEEEADLFISTYYTTPLSTPSVFMAYDMIPEVMQWDLRHPMWKEKHYAIKYASAYIAISQNTAQDLVKFFPDISLESVTVALCGVKHSFCPASVEEINHFKTKYGITKPYFLVVGTGGYKNTELFLQAFAQLQSKQGFEMVVTGGDPFLTQEWRAYTSGSVVHMVQLNDEELKAAYSGAIALVYPSKYEGFGLPVLEAMVCGCPVITCANASIPEVAGEAALYVKDDDINEMANALCDVQKPAIRRSLIAAGLEQAKKFSWSNMAQTVSSVLIDMTLQPLNLKEINFIVFPDWSAPEESLSLDLERIIKATTTHPDKSCITLLVDITGISQQDANLFLSGVAMDLLMQEDLDVTEELEISLVEQLSEPQWEALLPRLHARLVLEQENEQAIAQAKAQALLSYEVDSLIS